jgi:multiple sugar transport system substrate-binding protein
MPEQVAAALLSGAIYDDLYPFALDAAMGRGVEIRVEFTGDHPAINEHLARMTDLPYDIVSTHTKYAPSQRRFLAPLDGLLADDELSDFFPRLRELAAIDSGLYGIPRNFDVRLLHYRTDLIPQPPATWDDLFARAKSATRGDVRGFAYPGKESGLFGTFYELAEMAGAELFPADGRPRIQNAGGRWALGLLRRMYAEGVVSPQTPSWHYGEVHEAFRSGKAAMLGDWPGCYGAHRDPSSPVRDRFALCPYPTGPAGKSLAYGGGHTFALTKRGARKPAAVEAIRALTSFDSQLLEARHGSVPVRESVMQAIQSESTSADLQRWQTLEEVIGGHVLIPPKLACYPLIEEVIWKTVQSAILGTIDIDAALKSITDQICSIREENHA